MDSRLVVFLVLASVAGLAGALFLGAPLGSDGNGQDEGGKTAGQGLPDAEKTQTTAPSNVTSSAENPLDLDDTARPGASNARYDNFAGFEDVAAAVGLDYETAEFSGFVHDIGSYVVDFDNDGYEDLLLLGGDRPVLFENTGGTYEVAQTFDHPNAVSAHFFDYDNDGYRDLIIAPAGEPPVLYENRRGTYQKRPVGFDRPVNIPSGITTADFTGNGCLDVYIGDIGSGKQAFGVDEALRVAHQHPAVRPETDQGPSNVLYAGDCRFFHDVTEEANVGGSSFTMAVSAADLTGDGHVDIHAANDFTADSLYRNRGNGTFERVDMGPASDRNAMSSVAVDTTGSHRLDLFVTNVYFEEYDPETLVPVTSVALPDGNNLFANEGDGQFTDIAPRHDLEAGSWGWSATVADYTNDGHLDVIHAASFLDLAVVENHSAIFRTPQVWKGTADSWEKVDGATIGFGQHNLRGVTRVDYQNDGTLDFVAVDTASAVLAGVEPGANRTFLYENTLESEDSLQLWVRNPDGLERNAGVYVETDERIIYREANARGDLLSQDSRLIHVGTAHETVERVVVEWPDGTVTTYDDLSEGSRYILTPDDASPVE